jgi:hypothetical protein
MQKMNSVDAPYSATCNSQPLTFIDSDFVDAGNTQATDFNYELTFPNEHHHHTFQHTQQQLSSQLDNLDSSQVNRFDIFWLILSTFFFLFGNHIILLSWITCPICLIQVEKTGKIRSLK